MQNTTSYETDSYSEDAIDTAFIAEFYDGYSFKNLIDFLRRINTTAILEFTQDKIQCHHYDPDARNILSHVVIESKELYKYRLQAKKGEYRTGVNLRDLQKFIKSIGKKDSLTIYKKKGESSIYIQISNANNNKSAQNNFSVFRPCNVEQFTIAVPKYEMDESRPSLVIPASSISSTFNALNVLKSATVRIRVVGNDLTIDNLTDDRSSGRVDTFPMRVYDGAEPIDYAISVKVSTLKCLTKLNNLSPNGLLKFYLENGSDGPLPMKIVGKISNWALVTVYLNSVDQ